MAILTYPRIAHVFGITL